MCIKLGNNHALFLTNCPEAVEKYFRVTRASYFCVTILWWCVQFFIAYAIACLHGCHPSFQYSLLSWWLGEFAPYIYIYIYIFIIIVTFEKPLRYSNSNLCSTSQNLNTGCFNTSLYITNCGDLKIMFCSHWGINRRDFKNFFFNSFTFYSMEVVSPTSVVPASLDLIKVMTLTAWYYHGSFTGFGYPIFYISSEAILKSLVIS